MQAQIRLLCQIRLLLLTKLKFAFNCYDVSCVLGKYAFFQIPVSKNKRYRTTQLICSFIFVYAKSRFSHGQLIYCRPEFMIKVHAEAFFHNKIKNSFDKRNQYIHKLRENQRTNGPVNAHLISGPSISINHTEPD